jgi:malate dehydrogenase (oxaloacetate-decarboxylating)
LNFILFFLIYLKNKLNVFFLGGGAAGLSITKLLLKIGVESIIVCDTKGAIYKGRKEGMNDQKE